MHTRRRKLTCMSNLKKLMNSYEAVTDTLLNKVATEYRARVFAKIRIADVVPITSSGLPNDQYRYALMAHFDFVVTDKTTEPLFAVEFDGPLHEQDAKVIANDA